MAPYGRRYEPWTRLMLVPFWVLQVLGQIIGLGLAAFGTWLVYDPDNNSDLQKTVLQDEEKLVKIALPVVVAIVGTCLILTILEIVLLVRRRLQPLTFIVTNSIKSAIFTGIFVYSVIALVRAGASNWHISSLVIEGIVMLVYWIPLIYGVVVFRRSSNKTYKQVDNPMSSIQTMGNGYQSGYPNLVAKKGHRTRSSSGDLESQQSSPPNGRRASYNHERDTRFEAYKQQALAAPEVSVCPIIHPGSPISPAVIVQHHDFR